MTGQERERESTLAEYQALVDRPMQVLGIVWLGLLVFELTTGLARLFQVAVTVIWIVFVFDVVIRLWLATNRIAYLRRNWLTVISLALPALRFVRLAALARYALALRASRGARLLRIVASLNRAMANVRAALRGRAFGTVAALIALVILGAAAGMRALEEGTAGFESYGDSLWFTAMLVTGIGSEAWPATPEGRVLAFLVGLFGLAVLGYVASVLTSFFLGVDGGERRREAVDAEERELRQRTE